MDADQVVSIADFAAQDSVAVCCSGEVFCASLLGIKSECCTGNVEDSVPAAGAIRVSLSRSSFTREGFNSVFFVYHWDSRS